MFRQRVKHYHHYQHCVLPFISKPNLVRAPLIQSGYKALQKELALTSFIQSLLSKNAIERVENVKSLGFYSRLFLVPKPHQWWRPVIDLSRLNTFLLVQRFKMETPESIRASLISGEWVSSIDLSDAYLHIPILPNSKKYLRFCQRSQVFQFTSLPFGLATPPRGSSVCGLRMPSRFSPCKTHSREMAQTSGFDPTTQVKTCFDCKMFDVANWVGIFLPLT